MTVASEFLDLHQSGSPLLMANAWDVGSAKILAAQGFRALATTSSGYAATLGRRDGQLTREETLSHARQLVDATSLPVNADLENCFADDPEGVAETMRLAAGTGVAGASIEDYTGDPAAPLYEVSVAADRVRAAVAAIRTGPSEVVVTARAEGYLHGQQDLAEVIRRLQSFQDAGAQVLYAPGLTSLQEIGTLVRAVDRPVNVLMVPGTPSVAELADAGVARISVGGAFAFAGLAAMVRAARELLDEGTCGYTAAAREGNEAARRGFG